jgi:hypothetical protein
MSGPITNFELGKMQHREYEAEASRYWGQDATTDDKSSFSPKLKLALALSGAILTALTIVQIFAI